MSSDDPDLKGNDALDLDMVAFKKGGKTVVLLCNPTRAAKQMHVEGLSGTSVQTYVTTATQDMAAAPATKVGDGTATFDLPAQSVTIAVNG